MSLEIAWFRQWIIDLITGRWGWRFSIIWVPRLPPLHFDSHFRIAWDLAPVNSRFEGLPSPKTSSWGFLAGTCWWVLCVDHSTIYIYSASFTFVVGNITTSSLRTIKPHIGSQWIHSSYFNLINRAQVYFSCRCSGHNPQHYCIDLTWICWSLYLATARCGICLRFSLLNILL